MSYTLTDTEIKQIFATLQRKGVKYVDVQHELVDHIASAIEEITDEQPNLNFSQKLDLVVSKFTKNWSELVRSKEKSMNKYWKKKTFHFIKSYFTFPKAIVSIMMFIIISLGTIIIGKSIMASVLALTLILMIVTLVQVYRDSNFSRTLEKKYLVLRMFYGQVTTMLFLPLCLLNIFQVFNSENTPLKDQNWYIFTTSAIAIFTIIWCHASLTEFPRMLQKEIDNKYPYLKLTN